MENKPVWIGLDTEQISDWIDACPDWLCDTLMEDYQSYDELEDDESIPDDVFDRAKEWVISRSTDGRLSNEINETLYSTWLGEKFNDMVWDILMDFIRNEVREFKSQVLKED